MYVKFGGCIQVLIVLPIGLSGELCVWLDDVAAAYVFVFLRDHLLKHL